VAASTPRPPIPADLIEWRPMKDSPLLKRLLWSGLLAGVGALSSLAAMRVATVIWKKVFDEDPPE
jgi:hypothetical protein